MPWTAPAQPEPRPESSARLWEIADLTSEITRGNMSSQVRALSLIATIEGHIPARRPASEQNKPAPLPPTPDIYASAWLREQQENGVPSPDPAQHKAAPLELSDPPVPRRGRNLQFSQTPSPTLPPTQRLTLLDPLIPPAPRAPRKGPHPSLVSRWPIILLQTPESLSP